MTVSEKDQVNLPKEVQEAVGIKPSVAVKWVVTNAGALLTRDEPKGKGADIIRKL